MLRLLIHNLFVASSQRNAIRQLCPTQAKRHKEDRSDSWPTMSDEKVIMEGHDEAKPLKNFARIEPTFFKVHSAIYAQGELQGLVGDQLVDLIQKLATKLHGNEEKEEKSRKLTTQGRVAVYDILSTLL